MEITCIRDIRGENINWMDLGKRFRKFREARHMSQQEAGDQLNLSVSGIASFENELYEDRKSTNIIWNISFKWNLSLNWLLNGIGRPYDADPLKLMPETLIIQKGSGIRRNPERVKAEEGNFSDLALEFVIAIDKFKIKNDFPFPSWSQIFEIVTALGYRKAVPARIAPLGYIIEHQEWAEKLKHMNEEIDPRDDEYRRKIFSEKTLQEPASQLSHDVPTSFLKAQNPTAFIKIKTMLPSKVRYNIKRREKRQAAITSDSTLSEAKKQRRLKIWKRNNKFIFVDPEGRQHIVDNILQFCKEHKLIPSQMYSTASGQRKKHKGWRAQIIPTSTGIEMPIAGQSANISVLDRIKLGLISNESE